MRNVRLVTALMLGCAGPAWAQLAVTQPTTRLLILPLAISTPADSAVSIATMDAARDRLNALARYKVIVVPKAKLCEALKASGFPCDLVLDEGQSRELARFLNVHAYTTGLLEHRDAALAARVRVVDIGSSGFPFLFDVASNAPTPAGLGEAIAQRLKKIVGAGESARECNDKRMKGDLPGAANAAKKALASEPNLPAAHLCMATIYETQRLPPDSLIAAATRATLGDSLNPTAWETIARAHLTKGDTLKAVEAYRYELRGDPMNAALRLGIAELLRRQHDYPLAVTVLDEGLARKPGDPKFLDLKARICIEGQLGRCTLDGYVQRVQADTTLLKDSTFLKGALGAAQQVGDTQQLAFFSRAAVNHFPSSAAFWKALGAVYALKGMADSTRTAYCKSAELSPTDLKGALLCAKAIVDAAPYDTAAANRLKTDTSQLRALRAKYAGGLDTAHTYVRRALASSDSSEQLSAAVILLTGGSKMAQAGAYEPAYVWLDEALKVVAPRSGVDTIGPRQQVRVQASFWFGIASVASLQEPYKQMVASKSCADAKTINARLQRTRGALVLGGRVSPSFANTMLSNLAKFEAVMPQVKKQFKCGNF